MGVVDLILKWQIFVTSVETKIDKVVIDVFSMGNVLLADRR